MKKLLTALVMINIAFAAFAQTEVAPPPPPPPPPMDVIDAPPPPPPPPPPIYRNKQGYSISVWNNKVVVRKKDFKKEISLKEWNANKAKYEKMYGKVPPPPPPPPIEENVKFTPPVIKENE